LRPGVDRAENTANDQFARLLPPLVGPHTAVPHTPEGLGNEAQLAELFGREKIFGRALFCLPESNRAGVILHIAHGTIVWRIPALARTAHHDIASMIPQRRRPGKVTEKPGARALGEIGVEHPFNGLESRGLRAMTRWLTARCRREPAPAPV